MAATQQEEDQADVNGSRAVAAAVSSPIPEQPGVNVTSRRTRLEGEHNRVENLLTSTHVSSYSGYMGDINVIKERWREFQIWELVKKRPHTHNRISWGDLQVPRENFGLFLRQGHDALGLAELMETACSLEEESMLPYTRESYRDCSASVLHFWRNQGGIAERFQGERLERILRCFLRHFGKLSFFGILETRIKLSIVPLTIPPRGYKDSFDGGRSFVLWLDPMTGDPDCDLSYFLSVLLHEMSQVFLMRLSCRFDKCNERKEALGRFRHGEAWVRVARALEEATSRRLGLRLDLACAFAWTSKLRASRRRASVDLIKSLKMDEREVAECSRVWGLQGKEHGTKHPKPADGLVASIRRHLRYLRAAEEVTWEDVVQNDGDN